MTGTAAPAAKPTQGTLWDLLGEDAVEMRRPPKATALPVVDQKLYRPFRIAEGGPHQPIYMRGPDPADCREIHAAIGEILPPGVPTYVKAIESCYRIRGGIIVDVRVFDDVVARVELIGTKGARGCRWHSSGVEGTVFYWEPKAREWRRIPDPWPPDRD